MPARLEALVSQFALGLAAFETFAVGQHHRAQGGGDQQRTGELKGPKVLGEDQRGQALDIAAGIGLLQPDEAAHRDAAYPGDEQDAEAHADRDGRNALSPNRFDQCLRGVDADEHEYEQEEHHHCAGIDHYLHDAEEQRVLRDVEDRKDDHRGGQEHGRVHRFRCGDHADRTGDRDGAKHPEQHGFCRGGVAGYVSGR